METVRPLDVLNNAKGKEVTVELKNSEVYKGKVKAFDIHLNFVLFETVQIVEGKDIPVGNMLIRGDAIMTIKNI